MFCLNHKPSSSGGVVALFFSLTETCHLIRMWHPFSLKWLWSPPLGGVLSCCSDLFKTTRKVVDPSETRIEVCLCVLELSLCMYAKDRGVRKTEECKKNNKSARLLIHKSHIVASTPPRSALTTQASQPLCLPLTHILPDIEQPCP